MNNHLLIVGYGPGLSHSVAKLFLREGFAVSTISRGVSDSQASVGTRELADASDALELQEAISRCVARHGAVSVLVYNVAAFESGTLAELQPSSLQSSLAANVTGALVAAQAVLPEMRRKQSGTLLFSGGGLALHVAPGYGALSVGKAAIRNLALTLAVELAPENIHAATVTIAGLIQPGTYFDPERIAEVYWQLYLERPGQFRSEVLYRKSEGN